MKQREISATTTTVVTTTITTTTIMYNVIGLKEFLQVRQIMHVYARFTKLKVKK